VIFSLLLLGKNRYTEWEMNMESLSEILGQELENAVEVKDKKSLHRYKDRGRL